MREIVKGSRVNLVSLRVSEWCERDVYTTNSHTFLNNTGTVTYTSDLSCEIFVLWDTGAETTFLPHNLELIEEEPKDVYTLAQNSLEEVGIKVSRQILNLIAYRVVFGELLFEVMRKEKLDLQTTGAIIAALNKAIVGE